jgi:hypothetical protein
MRVRVVMLTAKLQVRPPVHSFGLAGEGVVHICSSAQPLADGLCQVQSSAPGWLPLTNICETVAMSAGEYDLAVDNRNPAPTAVPWAKKPCPPSPIVALKPFEENRILVTLPTLVGIAILVRQNYPILFGRHVDRCSQFPIQVPAVRE